MFEQYLGIKGEYPDALLFYRMGDFYELFFEDAEHAARELQIALTSRNPNAEFKVPMCGVPHHAADEYISQLLEKGYKVAICDQVEDPKQAKGLVRREVTRVLTPGTVVEDSNLHSKEHNFLCSLFWDGHSGAGGLAWVDFSTGEWSGIHSRSIAELWQWTAKLGPRELLLPQGLELPPTLADLSAAVHHVPVSPFFDLAGGEEKVCRAQNTSSLEPLDLESRPQLVRALGGLLTYLSQTQKQETLPLGEFQTLNLSRHLIVDEVTERNLEIFKRMDGRKGAGTLLHALDRTLTPMGGRLLELRLKNPWRILRPIMEHQECVRFFFQEDQLREDFRRMLDRIFDLERLNTRIQLGRCSPKDFVALRESLCSLPAIRELLTGRELPPRLNRILSEWDNLDDLRELLVSALVDSPPHVITEGGLFKEGFDPGLDEYMDLTEHGEARLESLLQHERQTNDLPKLKLGYNRVFGYYFELSRAHQGALPNHFIRRQTLANTERYITEELKEFEEKLLSASQKRKSLEYALFQKLREEVAQARNRLSTQARALARLDYWQGLAHAARQWEWTPPSLHQGLEIRIKGGRHPAIEACQGRSDFIPNDLHLTEANSLLLITGPNMAGKSTVLRQAAIITLLAQIGSFVPAQDALIGIADRIFSRVGASDNLSQGQSTFMVEMTETARILRQAGKRSLVILDEIGRGTSTFDGLALAWAVVLELAERKDGIRTLFATHYHELTDLEGKVPSVRNYNIAVKEWKGDIVFLRRMVPGPADRSYGIEVAKLAGVPQNVVRRAKEILTTLEEKARGMRRPLSRSDAGQRPLPGLAAPQSPVEPVEHPLIKELNGLDPVNLTPMQAMNLLNRWKEEWGSDAHKN
ncbi:MAG: DNA mismatch repair protein MutS [Desulfovibrionales bacterium]